jgi:hypothetical protein
MSAQPAEPTASLGWVPSPGERVVLRLDSASAGLPVRIASRAVVPARDTRVARMLRTPSIWGGALASLAVFALVSTAFATGTVRPAPPRVPTPRPGEPTATPDTRPVLAIGGFVLQPPLQPTPVVPGEVQPPPRALAHAEDDDAAPPEPADPTPAACTNPFGIGCAAPPPAPASPPRPGVRGGAPRTVQPSTDSPPAVPVPSPAARPDPLLDGLQAANVGPPRGSALESALQAATAADENFAREVEAGSRVRPPRETAPPPPSGPSSGK